MALRDEFDYYLSVQDSLVPQYAGKYVVIKDLKLIGVFDSQAEAVRETQKLHELGTFLVQLVTPGKAGYTQSFHSRVRFA